MPAQNETPLHKTYRTIELELVREPHPGGRPLFLDARRFLRICHAVELGESIPEACRRELVTYRNFRRHVVLNAKYKRRLQEAVETREQYLKEFHIANIKRHAPDNLSASLWWLEHRHPSEFAIRPFVRDSGDLEQQALCDKISLEQLVENAKLAMEVASNPPPALMPKQPDLPAMEASD